MRQNLINEQQELNNYNFSDSSELSRTCDGTQVNP